MDSRPRRHSHLSAEDGEREVVLCHACANEWYRDEAGLICPDCHSEITEIIDPENDPREPSSTSTSPEPTAPRRRQTFVDNDSDPEEDDIEEHLAGQHGFIYNRSTRSGADRNHHDPALEPTLHRFFDMINTFSPPPPDRNGDQGQETQWPPNQFRRNVETAHGGPTPHIHRATFRSDRFGGGTASFTIYSGPFPSTNRRTPPAGDGRADPFQDLFADVMRDLGPPHDQQQGGPPPFLRGLQELIGFLNPAHAVAGDAVYSQEALDRIISSLMEANPQSNAAPPASEDALNKLERRTVDKEMLKGDPNVECPICIDDLKEGDVAVYLPCKHFFHQDCVVLWLKEHNTCPICRTAIEKARQSSNPNTPGGWRNPNPTNSPPGFNPGTNPFTGTPFGGPSRDDSFTRSHEGLTEAEMRQRSRDRLANATIPQGEMPARSTDWFDRTFPQNQASSSEQDAQGRATRFFNLRQPSRPPSHGQSRLNEVIRNVSARQRDRDDASSPGYDTSRLQRRTSLSPTSPRTGVPGEQSSRVRQRSPSQSSGRWAASDREAQRETQRSSSGGGPLSWLRSRFSGSDSSSSREDRRR